MKNNQFDAITLPDEGLILALSFFSFSIAYFSRCLSRHLTHFVARPFSPKAAQGRKFLQPLHHFISRCECTTIHTFTSQRVQRPLFWLGMMAKLLFIPDAPLFWLLSARGWELLFLPFCFPPVVQGHEWPHMTQLRVPSGAGADFWFMWQGKLTKLLKSGTDTSFTCSCHLGTWMEWVASLARSYSSTMMTHLLEGARCHEEDGTP